MHEGMAALLKAFAGDHLDARRGVPTRLLHFGDEGLEVVHDVLHDDSWSLVTAGQYPAADLTVQLKRSYAWSELKSRDFDVVTTSQALEHLDYPWVTMLELTRVLRPGGLACLIASSDRREHLPAADSWRFKADGLIALVEWADLESLELSVEPREGDEAGSSAAADVMVVARRPKLPVTRRALAESKAAVLRRSCIRQADRRLEHLQIRRELRRREARRRAWAQRNP